MKAQKKKAQKKKAQEAQDEQEAQKAQEAQEAQDEQEGQGEMEEGDEEEEEEQDQECDEDQSDELTPEEEAEFEAHTRGERWPRCAVNDGRGNAQMRKRATDKIGTPSLCTRHRILLVPAQSPPLQPIRARPPKLTLAAA